MKTGLSQRGSVASRLRAGLRLATALTLPERDVALLIARIETSDLFDVIRPFVRRAPFPMRAFSFSHQPGPSTLADLSLSDFENEMELIREMGQDLFERYFLYEDSVFSDEEVALLCRIRPDQAASIRAFLLSISIQSTPVQAPSLRSLPAPIAQVDTSNGTPALVWLLPHLARGRYHIDYTGLGSIKPKCSRERWGKVQSLLRDIELLNIRQNTLWRILEVVLSEQKNYFLSSGNRAKLKELPAKSLAYLLSVHPSTISRAARERSLVMPWGEQRLISDLCPNRRDVVIAALEKILEAAKGDATDNALQIRLAKEFHLNVSRRTINDCRIAIQGRRKVRKRNARP